MWIARIIGSLLCLVLLVGEGFTQVNIEKTKGGFHAVLIRKFDVKSAGLVRTRNLVGNVRIRGGDSKQVVITMDYFIAAENEKEAQEIFERIGAEVNKNGNQIEIIGKEKYSCCDDYTYLIELPEVFNLDVRTVGGEIQLSQIKGDALLNTAGGDIGIANVTGSLNAETAGGEIIASYIDGITLLRTAGGDVELRNGSTGPFSLSTSGGEIELQEIRGDANVVTAGGNIVARNVNGNLELRTSGGEIILQNVSGVAHIAKTSGGDVRADNVSGRVDLRTAGGELIIRTIRGAVNGHTSGGDVNVFDVFGDVSVSTLGGELQINDVRGRVQGETSGGDVYASLKKGEQLDGPIRLCTSSGSIELQLPEDVKATIQAIVRIENSPRDYDIRSDFRLEVIEEKLEHRFGREMREVRASGKLNGGGFLIELETINGDINIEKVK
ncbi:MAG: DUF4097 family beta strand repeat-containing protein [bacterium]